MAVGTFKKKELIVGFPNIFSTEGSKVPASEVILQIRGAYRHLARVCKILGAREARRKKISCTPCKIRAPPKLFWWHPLIVFLDPDISRVLMGSETFMKKYLKYIFELDYIDNYCEFRLAQILSQISRGCTSTPWNGQWVQMPWCTLL